MWKKKKCFLVWIIINSTAFEQWNIPTWAFHLKYWQITLKFHFIAWTKVLKKYLKKCFLHFKFFDPLQETNLFFILALHWHSKGSSPRIVFLLWTLLLIAENIIAGKHQQEQTYSQKQEQTFPQWSLTRKYSNKFEQDGVSRAYKRLWFDAKWVDFFPDIC